MTCTSYIICRKYDYSDNMKIITITKNRVHMKCSVSYEYKKKSDRRHVVYKFRFNQGFLCSLVRICKASFSVVRNRSAALIKAIRYFVLY